MGTGDEWFDHMQSCYKQANCPASMSPYMRAQVCMFVCASRGEDGARVRGGGVHTCMQAGLSEGQLPVVLCKLVACTGCHRLQSGLTFQRAVKRTSPHLSKNHTQCNGHVVQYQGIDWFLL